MRTRLPPSHQPHNTRRSLLHPPPPTQVFEGIPAPYDKMKRMVVPQALRVTHLKPGRDFAVLGRLCHEVGWQHMDLITRLETARKAASEAAFKKKSEAVRRIAAAKKALSA